VSIDLTNLACSARFFIFILCIFITSSGRFHFGGVQPLSNSNIEDCKDQPDYWTSDYSRIENTVMGTMEICCGCTVALPIYIKSECDDRWAECNSSTALQQLQLLLSLNILSSCFCLPLTVVIIETHDFSLIGNTTTSAYSGLFFLFVEICKNAKCNLYFAIRHKSS